MESENDIESNTNNEHQNNNNNNEPYKKDLGINIDYEAFYKKAPDIKFIIINIKSGIDNIDKQQQNLKNNILELVRKLKESKLCEEDKISITIKEILRREIKDKKISSRWIEKILSDEKKRKYGKSKTNCSLSKKKKQAPLLVSDNSGNSFTVTREENTSTERDEKKDPFYYQNAKKEPTDFEFSNENLISSYKEYKDAPDKTTTFQSSNNSIKEIQFPKEKSKELITALDKCVKSVFIRFNSKGIVESIEPDTIREQQFEKVNDISDDNYT